MIEHTAEHTIFYSNKASVPLDELAASLAALARIVKRSPPILDAILDDAKVADIEIYLSELRTGSLTEKAIIKLFFGSQKEFDRFLTKTSKGLGLDKLRRDHPKMMGLLILTIVAAGGAYAVRNVLPHGPERNVLQNKTESMIQVTAETINIDPFHLENALVRNLERNPELARDAIRFVRPAKRSAGAEIILDDDVRTSIEPAVVSAFPRDPFEGQEPEGVEEYHDVEIQIRAIDLDSSKRGWAAKIPAISNERVKLQLAPFMNGEDLMERRVVRGDVTAVFEIQPDGSRAVRLYYLVSYEGARGAQD